MKPSTIALMGLSFFIGTVYGVAMVANSGRVGFIARVENSRVASITSKHEYVSYEETYRKGRLMDVKLHTSDGDKSEFFSGKTAIAMVGTK